MFHIRSTSRQTDALDPPIRAGVWRCIKLLPKRTRFGFWCPIPCHSAKAGCRPPASLEVLFRGPGGRHVSTTAAQRFTRSYPFCLCALLRWRPELLSIRGLHHAGAGVLLRRWHLLLGAALLRTGSALLRPRTALLLGAALLPAGPTLLPLGATGRLPALPEPGLGRSWRQWWAWTRSRWRPWRWPRRSPLVGLECKRRRKRRFLWAILFSNRTNPPAGAGLPTPC